MSRFRKEDRVSVTMEDPQVTVEGKIKSVSTSANGDDDSDLAEIVFLVEYDVEVGGRTEGLHSVDQLRLILPDDHKAPVAEESSEGGVKPSLKDYRSKVEARMNTVFDAFYVKSETGETWLDHVSVKGQYQLQQALLQMTLRDISELYGELEREVFCCMVTGTAPGLCEAYRNLAREVLHACLCCGCYLDNDGHAVDRFRAMMAEEAPEKEEEGNG